MVNLVVLCILFLFGCCGTVRRYTRFLWLPSVDVNLYCGVWGFSLIISLVVAFCCMYWIKLCHVLAWGVSWFQQVTVDVFNLLFCRCGPRLLHVRWGMLAWQVVALVVWCYVWCCKFRLFWIVGVVTINVDPVCRIYFVPVACRGVVCILACLTMYACSLVTKWCFVLSFVGMVTLKFVTVNLNVWYVLFVGAVPMINLDPFCFMYFMPVGLLLWFCRRVWRFTRVLCCQVLM